MAAAEVIDTTGARILAATMRTLIDFGVKRTTVDMVAKNAGVSHMTVYRRWPSRADLLREAVADEVERLFQESYDEMEQQDCFDDMVIVGFSGFLWRVINHPLMVREMQTEPEVILPFFTVSFGPILDAANRFTRKSMSRAAAANDLEITELDALAEVMVRVAHSLVLTPNPAHPMASRDDVDDYARRFLVPLARNATTPRRTRGAKKTRPARKRASVPAAAPTKATRGRLIGVEQRS